MRTRAPEMQQNFAAKLGIPRRADRAYAEAEKGRQALTRAEAERRKAVEAGHSPTYWDGSIARNRRRIAENEAKLAAFEMPQARARCEVRTRRVPVARPAARRPAARRSERSTAASGGGGDPPDAAEGETDQRGRVARLQLDVNTDRSPYADEHGRWADGETWRAV
jgi:hypothetical protein